MGGLLGIYRGGSSKSQRAVPKHGVSVCVPFGDHHHVLLICDLGLYFWLRVKGLVKM